MGGFFFSQAQRWPPRGLASSEARQRGGGYLASMVSIQGGPGPLLGTVGRAWAKGAPGASRGKPRASLGPSLGTATSVETEESARQARAPGGSGGGEDPEHGRMGPGDGRISPEPPGGRVCAASCRQGAPRSALPTPARRSGEQLGKGWAGCLRSKEAWAPLESALRPALVAPSTRPHGRAGVRTESGGSWGRPGN